MIESIKCICNYCKKTNFITLEEIKENDYIETSLPDEFNIIHTCHKIDWRCGACFTFNSDKI